MAELESNESEKQIIELIVHLRETTRMGYRKISKELKERGYDNWSKDKIRSRYLLHIASQKVSVDEMVDRELRSLRRKEAEMMRKVKLAEQKLVARKRIANLTVEEVMQNFEKREQLFNDEDKLLEFVEKTLPAIAPMLWYTFKEYCANEGFDLANAVFVAAGKQEDFEKQLETGEKLNLGEYLERQLRLSLDSWQQEAEEESEELIDETPGLIIEDGEGNLHIQIPVDNDSW